MIYVLNDWLQQLTGLFLLALLVAVLFVIALLAYGVIVWLAQYWEDYRGR